MVTYLAVFRGGLKLSPRGALMTNRSSGRVTTTQILSALPAVLFDEAFHHKLSSTSFPLLTFYYKHPAANYVVIMCLNVIYGLFELAYFDIACAGCRSCVMACASVQTGFAGCVWLDRCMHIISPGRASVVLPAWH